MQFEDVHFPGWGARTYARPCYNTVIRGGNAVLHYLHPTMKQPFESNFRTAVQGGWLCRLKSPNFAMLVDFSLSN